MQFTIHYKVNFSYFSLPQYYNPSSLLSCAANWDLLKYPFTRTSELGHIGDIQDGRIYQQWSEFLSKPEHTGLILNSDGAPIFKSASHSIWPVYLSVTSFPPKVRMNARNSILAGVWFGPSKPPMHVILDPVLQTIKEIKENGISTATIVTVKN